VPFSDPLADGPVIHAAATEALRRGARFETALDAVSALGDGVPAVVMCYANMVHALGAERFAGRIAAAGAAGAIVPDLPLEEGSEVREALAAAGSPRFRWSRRRARRRGGGRSAHGNRLRLRRLQRRHHRRAGGASGAAR
jgi:hypothetical protein